MPSHSPLTKLRISPPLLPPSLPSLLTLPSEHVLFVSLSSLVTLLSSLSHNSPYPVAGPFHILIHAIPSYSPLPAPSSAPPQVEFVCRERDLLSSCAHPFIIGLLGSFQTPLHLHLLMEVAPGGELYSLLARRQRLSELETTLYAGMTFSTLEYLHDRYIVYRDLKPENLLFDGRGYLKLVDFGFSKKIPPGEKTFTLCGTPEYIAPEQVLRKGHDCRADCWALGVLIYEAS